MTEETPPAYPVSVRGSLDEPISRWLFLVKWLLIVPHIIVLAFLFIGFLGSVIISFFAILFTGRYPRGLFDFNVGVLRWAWRVGFYSYEALGTDKYPPFTLRSVEYQADLTVEYPERLSCGLALIKWLLAIPHYIVVGIFKGGGGRRAEMVADWCWCWSCWLPWPISLKANIRGTCSTLSSD